MSRVNLQYVIKKTKKSSNNYSTRDWILGLLIIYCLLGLALVPQSASATAISNGSVKIDWSTFRIVESAGVTYNMTSQENWDMAEANSSSNNNRMNFDQHQNSPWSKPIQSAQFTVFDANATGTLDSSEVKTTSYAHAEKPILEWGHGLAGSRRMADFTVTGNGTITITVDYRLDVMQLSTTKIGEVASIDLQALINLGNITLDQSRVDKQEILDSVRDGQSKAAYWYTGTLTLTQDFHNGDAGYMRINASSEARATAPVPATWTLLLIGMGMMRAAGRVRRAMPLT